MYVALSPLQDAIPNECSLFTQYQGSDVAEGIHAYHGPSVHFGVSGSFNRCLLCSRGGILTMTPQRGTAIFRRILFKQQSQQLTEKLCAFSGRGSTTSCHPKSQIRGPRSRHEGFCVFASRAKSRKNNIVRAFVVWNFLKLGGSCHGCHLEDGPRLHTRKQRALSPTPINTLRSTIGTRLLSAK